jgi:hypothetical protein
MSRKLVALFVVAVGAGPAAAQAPPALTTAWVDKGQLLLTVTERVPVTEVVSVEVLVGEKKVVEQRTVTVFKTVEKVVPVPLDQVKATDAPGKPIPADKLTELLKEKTPVVVSYSGPVPEAYRKLFKDGTVVLQIEAPKK